MRNLTNKIGLFIVALLIISHVAWADLEAPPFPYVTVSKYGRYYFKMIPDKQNSFDRESGSGYCYKVTTELKDKVLWTTKGWYSFSTHLSDDGKYLIRIGNWPIGTALSDDDLAVAFYKEGQLISSYSTEDLVKDSSAIEITVSHYSWLSEIKDLEPFSYRFSIVTIDNIEYIFDIENGKIVSQKKL